MNKKVVSFFALLPLFLISKACQTTVDSLPNESRIENNTSLPIKKNNPVALVLGGGGARGIAHLAAIETLEEAGIPIDVIVGCSSGSIVGSLYAANVDIKAIKELLFKTKREEIINHRIPKRFGLLKHTRLRAFLKEHLSVTTFDQLKIPLVVVATDLITGELVEYERGEIIPAVVGSSSIPLLFEPIKYDNRILVDGGVVNPLPVKTALKKKPGLTIAIDVGNDLHLEKPTNLIGVARRSFKIMRRESAKRQYALADIVIKTKMRMDVLEADNEVRIKYYQDLKEEIEKKIPTIKRLYSQKILNKHFFNRLIRTC